MVYEYDDGFQIRQSTHLPWSFSAGPFCTTKVHSFIVLSNSSSWIDGEPYVGSSFVLRVYIVKQIHTIKVLNFQNHVPLGWWDNAKKKGESRPGTAVGAQH